MNRQRRMSLSRGNVAPFVVVALFLFLQISSPAAGEQITGTWTVRYEDANGDRFPSRLARGMTFDEDPDSSATFREIGPTGVTPPFPALYTGLDGRLTATLDNFEPGGIDPALRMRTEAVLGGRNIEIYTSGPPEGPMNFPTPGSLYAETSDALPNQNANFAAADDLSDNQTFTGGAFAAMDGLVTGMRYANYLGGRDTFVDVIYPSAALGTFVQKATTMVGTTTQYRMHIVDANVFDWDVLLHEYGHTVSRANNFDDSTGGPHVINETSNIYLAWSEGYANFYQGAAQNWENGQPGNGRLPNVREREGAASPTIRSSIDTYIDDAQDFQWSLETRKTYSTISAPVTKSPEAKGAKSEMAVTRILWDLFDGTGGGEGRKDEVTLGHKGTFNLLTTIVNPDDIPEKQHGPQTIRELETNCAKLAGDDNVYRAQLGAIFAEHGVAPKAVKARAAMAGGPIGPAPPEFDLDPDESVPTANLNDPFVFDFFQLRTPPQDEAFEAYHIQFFREVTELTPVVPIPEDGGPTDDTVLYHDRELILSLDMGLGEASGIDPELRSFQPTLMDWQSLVQRSEATLLNPAVIWWNVVGLATADATDGSWSNALSFLVSVPEPSTVALAMFAAMSLAAFSDRRRRLIQR